MIVDEKIFQNGIDNRATVQYNNSDNRRELIIYRRNQAQWIFS